MYDIYTYKYILKWMNAQQIKSSDYKMPIGQIMLSTGFYRHLILICTPLAFHTRN